MQCMFLSHTKLEGALVTEKEIPNMDKSSIYRCMKTLLISQNIAVFCHRKTETFGNMKILNMRLRQFMVYLCFSCHLQVINKVHEQ